MHDRIREEFECPARAWKTLYITVLDWLCWQSKANPSLPAIAEMQGDFAKLQGERRHPPGKISASQRLG
jgi:hypothetical protein